VQNSILAVWIGTWLSDGKD